jgi:ZIP family zinc transporter
MFGALGWGLVAGSAFVIGGVFALRFSLSARSLGLLQGFGAGALIAAVAYELVDEAGQLGGGYGRVGIGLVIGSFVYLFATGYWSSGDEEIHVTLRSMAVTVVPEAVIIVGGLLAGHHISAAVIAAIFLCGVPEAFVTTGRLLELGLTRRRVILVWIAMMLVCGVSAGAAYGLLDEANTTTVALVLAIAGGIVLTELATELVPESRALAGPLAGTAVVIGFGLVFGLVEVS